MTEAKNLPLDAVAALDDRALLCAILSYTQPNEAEGLAEHLLAQLSTLSAILHADRLVLRSLGASEHTVSLLEMLLPAYGRICRSCFPEGERFDTREKISEYFSYCFSGAKNEAVYLLLLREDYTLMECRRMASGSVNSANLNVRAMIEAALFSGAKRVAVAHNHPNGVAKPSQADIATTMDLKNACSTVGIHLVDHIIVAEGTCTSVLQSAYGFDEA